MNNLPNLCINFANIFAIVFGSNGESDPFDQPMPYNQLIRII